MSDENHEQKGEEGGNPELMAQKSIRVLPKMQVPEDGLSIDFIDF